MNSARLLELYDVDFNIFDGGNKRRSRKRRYYLQLFHKNNFKYLQFIPCIDPLEEPRGSFPFSLRPAEYTRFLIHFFDRWHTDILSGGDISVRYFDNLVRMLMGMMPETCSMRGICSCQFVFEADGSCYPCDFYVTEKWRLGNIRDMGIMDFYKSETNQRFLETSKPLPTNVSAANGIVSVAAGAEETVKTNCLTPLAKIIFASLIIVFLNTPTQSLRKSHNTLSVNPLSLNLFSL